MARSGATLARRIGLLGLVLAALLAHRAPAFAQPAAASDAALRDEVWKAEEAFAKTMADRDMEAFAGFLSLEAVFWGPTDIIRGPEAIVAAWREYFSTPAAPFAWRPETVAVAASGSLAYSSGPILDPSGRRIGTFNTVWQKDGSGRWRVLFDKGCPPPPPPRAQP